MNCNTFHLTTPRLAEPVAITRDSIGEAERIGEVK
jgi:hypothetical protein